MRTRACCRSDASNAQRLALSTPLAMLTTAEPGLSAEDGTAESSQVRLAAATQSPAIQIERRIVTPPGSQYFGLPGRYDSPWDLGIATCESLSPPVRKPR